MAQLRMTNPQMSFAGDKREWVQVSGECFFTGRKYLALYPAEGFRAWYTEGAKIQEAMPEVSAGDREWLISGTHPEVFDEMFPDE